MFPIMLFIKFLVELQKDITILPPEKKNNVALAVARQAGVSLI